MARPVKVQCGQCSDLIVISADRITLRSDDERDEIQFECPRCHLLSQLKILNPAVTEELREAGCIVVEPPRYPEQRDGRNLPPLTLDDVIDFHLNFEEDLEALLNEGR